MSEERQRIICHVDMDHFFTAVEERENPSLKGKPIIVGADPKEGRGRGVVSTCNYEARRFGVKSGIPISRAWKLCPEAIYLPVNYALYSQVSQTIMAILRKHSEKFEQWGIDEAFLDLTPKEKDYREAQILAIQIKKEIFEQEHLTCSIGIAPNKLVAKIASDFQKPDGLTVVRASEKASFLAPLPVRKLLWVGKKTETKLKGVGIETIGDLALQNPTTLQTMFGSMGVQLFLTAKGIDRTKVGPRGKVKSISREVTFEEDTSNLTLILDTLVWLSEKVQNTLVTQNRHFKTVTLKMRYENFETHTYSKTLPFATDRLKDLTKMTEKLLYTRIQSNRKLRLVGVKVSNLLFSEKQRTLVYTQPEEGESL